MRLLWGLCSGRREIQHRLCPWAAPWECEKRKLYKQKGQAFASVQSAVAHVLRISAFILFFLLGPGICIWHSHLCIYVGVICVQPVKDGGGVCSLPEEGHLWVKFRYIAHADIRKLGGGVSSSWTSIISGNNFWKCLALSGNPWWENQGLLCSVSL